MELTFDVWRDKAGGVMASAVLGVSDWTRTLSESLDEALTYKTGEMTSEGRFSCKGCGTTMRLKKAGHLPPCPKRHKTEFRRA